MTQAQAATVASALVTADYTASASKQTDGTWQVTAQAGAAVSAATVAGFAAQYGVNCNLTNAVFT